MFLKLIAKIFYLLKCWKFRFRQKLQVYFRQYKIKSISLNNNIEKC